MRFFRHCGIYHPGMVFLFLTPGPLSRSPVGSVPGYIGHAGKNMPCPPFVMSSGRLFLDGLLASIAHLRFTDFFSLKLLPVRRESFTIER
jgi:hypothetical protein